MLIDTIPCMNCINYIKMIQFCAIFLLVLQITISLADNDNSSSLPAQIWPAANDDINIQYDKMSSYYAYDYTSNDKSEKIGQLSLADFFVDAGGGPSSIQVQCFHDEDPVTFFKKSEVTDGAGGSNYYWYGEDINRNGINTLNILLTHEGRHLTGSAAIGSQVYNFLTLPDGSVQVREVDSSSLPPELEDSVEYDERDLLQNYEVPVHEQRGVEKIDDTEDGSTIDVMCLYTPQSVCKRANKNEDCDAKDQNHYRLMDDMCKLSIIETNVAFEMSGVETRLQLVHSGLISSDYVEEVGLNMCRPVNHFRSSTEDAYVNARRLREEYGADLVSLIVSGGSWCGCADSFTGSDQKAFSVVHYHCATGYFSFGHEIGHNLGCNHDDSEKGSNHFAYGYKDPSNAFRTILAYPCKGGTKCNRIQRFSSNNDKFKYREVKIGDRFHNNVKQINATSKIVANFRKSKNRDDFQPSTMPSTNLPLIQPTSLTTNIPIVTSIHPSTSPMNQPSTGSMPTLSCRGNFVSINIQLIGTNGEGRSSISWDLMERNGNIILQSEDFEESNSIHTCLWSGDCYSFKIKNSVESHNQEITFKVNINRKEVASGLIFDTVTDHNFGVDFRQKKVKIGLQKKSCSWLKKSDARIRKKCKKFRAFRFGCPQTCNSCTNPSDT